MTNFIFKSVSTDLQKISQQLKILLVEQRQQRSDLSEIKFMLHKLQNNKDLQETVDKYYKDAPDFAPPQGSGDPED